jgi:hypothetical protein
VQLPHALRGDRGDGLGGRHLRDDGVVAETTAHQRLAGDGARLRAGDGDPLGQPGPLAGDLGVGVGGGGEHVGEDVEDRRQTRGQRGAARLQVLRVDGDAELPADRGQRVVDADPVAARGAGQDGLGEHLGARGAGGVGDRLRRGGRDAQDGLDQRDPGAARGQDGQPVRQGLGEHVRQRHLLGAAERGQRAGAALGAADLLRAAVCAGGAHAEPPSVWFTVPGRVGALTRRRPRSVRRPARPAGRPARPNAAGRPRRRRRHRSVRPACRGAPRRARRGRRAARGRRARASGT